MICLLSQLVTTLIALYLTVSKPILIYQEEQWNNFDISLETPLEADTIHTTYDIFYQTIKERDIEVETKEISQIHLHLNLERN